MSENENAAGGTQDVDMSADPWNVTAPESAAPAGEQQAAAEPQPGAPVPAVARTAVPVSAPQPPAEKLRDDFGLVSMVCGIISIVLGFAPWGILGIVFAILAKRGTVTNSHSTVGLVCSIVSAVLHLLLIIVLVLLYVGFIVALASDGLDGFSSLFEL